MSKKLQGLLIILLCYLVSYAVAFVPYCLMPFSLLSLLVFDVIATVAIFIFSVVFRNSSVYDAYWSLTPFVILVMVLCQNGAFTTQNLLFLGVFGLWSWRLTVNWVITFRDMSVQDWRYEMYKNNFPKFWQVINFFGIHLMPTLLVFAGTIPAICLFTSAQGTEQFFVSQGFAKVVEYVGYAVMLFATAVEFFADRQVHQFLRANAGQRKVCNVGLWKYSRHPNYLGEVSFWYGVFLVYFASHCNAWYYVFGAVAITVLFLVVSIPMMEKRQLARRSEYAQYRQSTSKLLLLPNKKFK